MAHSTMPPKTTPFSSIAGLHSDRFFRFTRAGRKYWQRERRFRSRAPIEQQKLLKGGKNADPFVIAKAAIDGRAVVTMEQLRPNAVKIPNICQYFGVKCLSLDEFMEEEGWQF